MSQFLDSLRLDDDNPEFRYAVEFVLHTNRMLYLTGKAGTGKTTFLRFLKTVSNKNMVVLAPTGVAAVNAGGQTIHSFFNIKPSVYVPGDKRLRTRVPADDPDKSIINDHFRYHRDKLEIIRSLELLVIDEISMVRCDLLDVIDRLLRVFRKREFTPFGGVQMVLIGDTFQLPPIVNQDDWNILGRYYSSPFFFSSRVMLEQKPVYIELKKIYRQSDQDFIDMLNRIRINRLIPGDLERLNSRYLYGFNPEQEEDYIILATHNRLVEETNERRLHELDEPVHRFEAVVEGVFPESSFPTDRELRLKEGAQVMFLKNDRNRRFYNGKIGHIAEISGDGIFIETDDGDVIEVGREEWANIRYSWDAKDSKVVEEIAGSFIQYPVKLAWAITVHKSQGLTFEKIIADLEEAFAPGQVYVALSRCTSFSGILLRTPLNPRAIKTDPDVLGFAANVTPETLLISELETGKSANYLKRALSAYLSQNPEKMAEMLISSSYGAIPEMQQRTVRLTRYAIDRFLRSSRQLLERAVDETARGAADAVTDSNKRKRMRQMGKKLKTLLKTAPVYERLWDEIRGNSAGINEETDYRTEIRRITAVAEELTGALRSGRKRAGNGKPSGSK